MPSVSNAIRWVDGCYSASVAFIVVLPLSFLVAAWRWQVRRRGSARHGHASAQHSRDSPQMSQSPNAIEAKADFLRRVGSNYGYPSSKKGFIDDWRASEFPTLVPPLNRRKFDHKRGCNIGQSGSPEPEVYLDYAGSAIPPKSLLLSMSNHCQIMANPHSQGGGLASDRTLKLMQKSKDCIMNHFGIDHEVFGVNEIDADTDCPGGNCRTATPCPGYQLVFTSGATESLRLVAERFPWSSHKLSASQYSHLVESSGVATSDETTGRLVKSVQVCSLLVYPRNVHTSVIGMRQAALQRGSRFRCVSMDELRTATTEWFQELLGSCVCFEYWPTKLDTADLNNEEKKDDQTLATRCKTIWVHHLLVLPLECNFSGDRYDWANTTAMALKSCSPVPCMVGNETIMIRHKWNILLDTAKAAATGPVFLPNLVPEGGPDFAVVSFYKLFGAPTGLGALFVKKDKRRQRHKVRIGEEETLEVVDVTDEISTHLMSGGLKLESTLMPRQFFGGGSVDVVLVDEDYVVPRASAMGDDLYKMRSHQRNDHVDMGVMVHGTQHFRGIADLALGFQEVEDLGGMEAISSHSCCLAAELVRRLVGLVHDTGRPVVQVYGNWRDYVSGPRGSNSHQGTHSLHPGPTVSFNVCYRDGSVIGYDEVSRLATLNSPPIQIRTGCFCNPGGCQDAISLTNADVLENFASGHVCGDRRGIVNGKHTGAVRASFGKDSIWEDMDALASFIERTFVSRGEVLRSSGSDDCDQALDSSMKIEQLFIYPIKSCAATRVKRWPINQRTGRLAFDREFALVDTSGSAMRLHSYPQMSAISTIIDLGAETMTVRAPNHKDLVLSLECSKSTADDISTSEDIRVCGDMCKGNVWGGSKASKWFTSVLGVRCWLARHDESKAAKISPNERRQHAFGNEASLLLVSQQSISFLNSVIAKQQWGRLVEARHFRPNLLVSCSQEVANASGDNHRESITNPEDLWQEICIKGDEVELRLKAVGKCARCQMVDIDPSSGMKGNTLRALAQYRRDRGSINFGTFFTGDGGAPDRNMWLEEGSDVVKC